MCRRGADPSNPGRRRQSTRWPIVRPISRATGTGASAATLTELEEYNGLGYASRGVPSPYVWSGTDQYKSGKYVRDGVYDPTAVDSQPGCAGLLLAMMALDRTISFDGKMPPIVVLVADSMSAAHIPKPPPSITNPAKGSIGAFIASILSAIFNSKRK